MITEEFINKTFQKAVVNAEQKALEEGITPNDAQKLHALRARKWVEALAENFREHYKKEENIRVFSKYYKGKNDTQRKEFGLNELLFDISVCRINYTEAPKHHTKLPYIEKALWIVESEMANDARQLVLDFSKLVMGDAEYKLFVGSITNEDQKNLEIFKRIAVNCKGNVYLALVPHPGRWDDKLTSIMTEQLK
jgi:hypothetical protein